MILITGATGTVGSEVVKRSSAKRAVTRDLRKVETNRLPNAQFVQGNFDDVGIRCAERARHRASVPVDQLDRER
jgi:nucleoside-diphosphate-sugar epimerase